MWTPNITKDTTIEELMADSLCGKTRNIYDKNGIIIGTVLVQPASELWIKEQKAMNNLPTNS